MPQLTPLPPAACCGRLFEDTTQVMWALRDNFDNYIKSDVTMDPPKVPIYGFDRLLGKGIFGVDHGPHALDGGHGWHLQRKTAANIFTRNQFRTFMREVFVRKGRARCARLDAVARDRGEVDLQRCFFKFTMDSITEIAFAEKEHVGGGPSFGELFDDAHRLLTYLVPAGFLPLTAIGMLQPSWLRNAALYARRKVPRNTRLQRKRLRCTAAATAWVAWMLIVAQCSAIPL